LIASCHLPRPIQTAIRKFAEIAFFCIRFSLSDETLDVGKNISGLRAKDFKLPRRMKR
jgi:hypothetical protein